MTTKIIIVSGGIGSGKSVVCHILESMGYLVYDCDKRARQIMDNAPEIRYSISQQVSSEAINLDGSINRPLLAEIVFNDPEKLVELNSIVHAAVRADIAKWSQSHDENHVLFVETAIMYQSGLDRMADMVWEVTAPDEVRIERVCNRNNLTPQQVKNRILSQRIDVANPHPKTSQIVNDGYHSIIAQINNLLDKTDQL